MKCRLYHAPVCPPMFPIGSQDPMADIFGKVHSLQGGFLVAFVLFLENVFNNKGIPGEYDSFGAAYINPENIPEPVKILPVEGKGVFKDPFPVPEYFPSGNSRQVLHLE